MIEYLNIFLPKSKKEVKIEISVPRYYHQNTKFDTLYLLDGQNAFKDANASFNRAIRATKYLGYMASQTNQKIIGVAIHNAESEMGRINEYTPFKITNPAEENWIEHDINQCHNFCYDLINTIIPYIEHKYPTTHNRYIYGSSLAAITAIYLGYKYDVFKAIGAFSCASFLCSEFNDFIIKNLKKDVKLFLYVGKREVSDGSYDQKLYYNTALETYHLVKKYTDNARLVISESGTHDEATWERQLLDFLSYIYFDNIIYKY